MQIIEDTISFIKTLSFVDVVFFLAVLALMLLIITLIYFIRENKYEEESIPLVSKDLEEPMIKLPEENDEDRAITSLAEINKVLEDVDDRAVLLNNYETEQEEKAIISYEELLKRKNDYAINYSEEERLDDLSVKKVDLDNLLNKDIHEENKVKVTVISYEKEEAFLKALKALQEKLN